MRSFRNFFVPVVLAALVAVGTANLANGQGRTRGGTPAASAPAPAPVVTPAPTPAPAPAPTPTPTPTAPAEPAFIEKRVSEMIDAAITAHRGDTPHMSRELVEGIADAKLKRVGEALAKVDQQLDTVDQQLDTIDQWQTVSLIGNGVLFVLLVVLFVLLLRFFRRPQPQQQPRREEPPAERPAGGRGPLNLAVAILAMVGLVASSTSAATAPKVVCGDPQFMADFFEANGADQEVVCVGVKGARVETGDPTNVPVKDVTTDSKGRLTFKITPSTGATLDYLELTVDGKSVGKPIEVVSPAEFRSRDRSITSLTQVLRHQGGGVSGGSAREDMRWLALFNGVCGSETGKGRCGRELSNAGLTGAELFKQLKKARTQVEEDAVMRQLALAVEFNGADRVFSDPRLKEVISAGVTGGLTAYFAANPPAAAVDLTPLTERVTKVEAAAAAAQTAADAVVAGSVLTGRRLGGIQEMAEAAAEAVSSVRGSRPVLGGGGLSKEARMTLAERLACARHLALTGEVKDGCPEPVR